MLVAVTVTPALCLMLLPSAPLERRESPFERWLERRYERVLAPIVHGGLEFLFEGDVFG